MEAGYILHSPQLKTAHIGTATQACHALCQEAANLDTLHDVTLRLETLHRYLPIKQTQVIVNTLIKSYLHYSRFAETAGLIQLI